MNTPRTILVTGCAGFIGSQFINAFQTKYPETHIVGIDDLSSGRKEAVSKTITFVKMSVTNTSKLETLFTEHAPEYVFHFAALPRVAYSMDHPTLTAEANILGTIALLEVSARHKVTRFIYSASSSAYGNTKKLPTKESENTPSPVSPYALQKYTGELWCKHMSEVFGLDTVCLRYFNVFGPGQYGDSAYSTVISAWLESLYFPTKKVGFIEGDGKQSRDFAYIDNVISANMLAMTAPKPLKGISLNIANSERTTITQIKKELEKITGKIIILEKRPTRAGDVKHTHADITLAKKTIGYKPLVSFSDGLVKTVAWFESRSK
jgi:nucleoside-diphosphate-sugar epimerase